MLRLTRLAVVGSLLCTFSSCDTGDDAEVASDPVIPVDVLEPEDVVLDDFEDANLSFVLPDGSGIWHSTSSDGIAVLAGGANATTEALHALEPFDAILSPEATGELMSHDYASCSGLSLWARVGASSGELTITVVSVGGSASQTLDLTGEWQSFSIDWEDFGPLAPPPEGAAGAAGAPAGGAAGSAGSAPEGAGGAAGSDPGGAGGATSEAGFDPHEMLSIHFDSGSAMDLWIDEIMLLDCLIGGMNPPIPDPAPLGSAGPEGSPVARHGQLRVDGSRLLDQSGDPVQLKGMSTQWLNWETRPYGENLELLRFLRDEWNLSLIRAAMGVDVDGAYLSNPDFARGQVEQMVENAIELGVYVIIDWHSHYAMDFESEARAFFSDMARRYGEHPNVIYETFNEPRDADWNTVLKPYHEAVVSSIRAWDPDNLVVLGTPNWSQHVNQAAANPVAASNLLYTLHFYSCTHGGDLRSIGENARILGLPLFVTEWGATDADGGRDGLVCEPAADAWLAWMEENSISWAAWKLDGCTDSTCIMQPGTPPGALTEADLHGHATLVRDWMQR
jgi:aryl-phospho-beta-D-glucosidase BglC (GH1 family)